jgi:uncharacterized protein
MDGRRGCLSYATHRAGAKDGPAEEGTMEQPQAAPGIVIAPEERGLAVMAHLSGLAGYIIPCGGVLVPIIIWMVKSDSKVISSIAKQALILNLAIFVTAAAAAVLLLTVILIPLVIVLWVLLAIAAIALPIVGAVKASDGKYYRYPLVGVWPR